MRKTLFLALLSFSVVKMVTAQDLKTYNGDYDGGKATYQYFENAEYERIYQGDFSLTDQPYKMQVSIAESEAKFSCKGKFKNGYKDGEWVFIADNFKGGDNSLLKDTFKGTYKNGYKNGLFTYTRFNKSKNINILEIKVNYRNDTIVGDFTAKHNKFGTTVITGQLDGEGFATGTWTEKSKESVMIYKFYDGYCYDKRLRNLQTGSVDVRIDDKENYEKLKTDHWVYGETRYTSSRAIRDKLGLVQAEWNKFSPYWPIEDLSYVASDLFLLYARIDQYNKRFDCEVFPYFAKGSRNDKMEFIPFKVLGDFENTKYAKIETEFNNLKSEADKDYKYKRYTSANKLYKQALKLKPNNTDLPKLIAETEKAIVKEKEEKKQQLELEAKIKAIEEELETNTSEISNSASNKVYVSANSIITRGYSTKKIISDDKSQFIDEYITVQRKLVELSKSTNKTVEKALKKASTFSEVKAAIGI